MTTTERVHAAASPRSLRPVGIAGWAGTVVLFGGLFLMTGHGAAEPDFGAPIAQIQRYFETRTPGLLRRGCPRCSSSASSGCCGSSAACPRRYAGTPPGRSGCPASSSHRVPRSPYSWSTPGRRPCSGSTTGWIPRSPDSHSTSAASRSPTSGWPSAASASPVVGRSSRAAPNRTRRSGRCGPAGSAGGRWPPAPGSIVTRTVWTTYLWLIPYALFWAWLLTVSTRMLRHAARADPVASRRALIVTSLVRVRLPGRPTWADNDRMRTVCRLLAVAGGLALAAPSCSTSARGNPGHPAWVLIGPLPFYAVGLVDVRVPARQSGRPLAARQRRALRHHHASERHPAPAGQPAPGSSLVAQWVGNVGLVVLAIVGLVGLFPVGRPDHRVDRVVLAVIAASGDRAACAGCAGRPDDAAANAYAEPGTLITPSPIFVDGLAPLGPVDRPAVRPLPPVDRSPASGCSRCATDARPRRRRRQIRLLLVGWAVGLVLIARLGPDLHPGGAECARHLDRVRLVLWPVTAALVLGSLLVALFYEGVFGIDRPARRRHVALRCCAA